MDVKASVAENLIVGKQRTPAFSRLGIHLRRGQVKKYAQELTRTFDIRTSGVDEPAGSLSGGNMQKVVLAREFSFGSPVLLCASPREAWTSARRSSSTSASWKSGTRAAPCCSSARI